MQRTRTIQIPALRTTVPAADLERLAHAVAADGPERHSRDLAVVAHRAIAAGLSPAVASVLLDAGAPPVARQRALGRALAHLARHTGGGTSAVA